MKVTPNLVRHYNDPDTYYNIDTIQELRIDRTGFSLTFLCAEVQPVLAIESFQDEPELDKRLLEIINILDTKGSQYPITGS